MKALVEVKVTHPFGFRRVTEVSRALGIQVDKPSTGQAILSFPSLHHKHVVMMKH